MKKRKKEKIIVGLEVLLLCMILGILRINATSSNPPSSEVNYNKNSQTNVQGSINDLYNKVAYGDAMSSDILSGKTALVGGKKVVGTYKCPTLSSQTPGDATPEDITEGKIAWVNGNKIVGTSTTLANKVKLGDYISYTPSTTSYTISKEDTDCSYNDFINPSKLNLWRVIRKNDNGTVDIISHDITSRICLNVVDRSVMYSNYVGILNKIAKQYETEGYTVGSRHVGYNGMAKEYCDGVNTCFEDGGYQTDLELIEKAIGSWRVKIVGTLPATGYTADYWLASRADNETHSVYYFHYDAANSHLCGRRVLEGNNANSLSFHGSIRPIVVLKSDLKVTGGDGTESSPYTLGV